MDSDDEESLADSSVASSSSNEGFSSDPIASKKRRRDESTYGVFFDDEDDGYADRREKRGRKNKDASKPVSFVSSSAATREEDEEQQPDEEEEDLKLEEELKEKRKEANERFKSLLARGKKREKKVEEKKKEEGEQGFGGAPGLGLGATHGLGLGLGATPGLGLGATPGLGLGATPGLGLGATPGLGLGATPGLGLGATPGLGLGATPGLGLGATPGLGLGAPPPPTNTNSFVKATPTPNPNPMSTPARIDPNLGQWEKHTKGFGMKLLKKMGFKGRLGAQEKGVSKTVEVVVRPGGLGLGFGNFKEQAQLKGNKVFEAQLRGEDVMDEKELTVSKKDRKKKNSMNAIQARLAKEEQWLKTSSKPKSKKKEKVKKYVTAEDLINNAAQSSSQSSANQNNIIDMRGPDTKLVSSSDGLEDSASEITSPIAPQVGDELLFNISHIISNVEMDIQTKAYFKQKEEKKMKELTEKKKLMEESLEKNKKRKSALIQITQSLQSLQQTSAPDPQTVVASFDEIQRTFPDEFDDLNLQSLVPTFVGPHLEKELKKWNVVKYPELASNLLNKWTQLLTPENLQTLFTELMFPSIQRQVSFWDPTDPEPIEKLYESLKSVLPPHTTQTVLDDAILPRVRSFISNEWDATKCPSPPHHFVFPWLPHSDLSDTFPLIRKNIVASLNTQKGWKVKDDSVINLIKPWKKVMDEKHFNALVNKTVVPQLTKTLSTFKINPADQDVETIKAVLAWSDLLQPEILPSLVEGEFVLNWLNVLHEWCDSTSSPTPTLKKELGEFYVGWKGLLAAVISDDVVIEYLHSALCIIEAKCDEVDLETVKPPKRRSMTFNRALERRAKIAQEKETKRRNVQKSTVASNSSYIPGVSMSFKDLAISQAEEKNIRCLITSKAVGGKDVYQWGEKNVTVYFDGNLVYARNFNDDSKEYKLVSLNDLLSNFK
ncbi:hypothetical protein TrLO_g3981 [Triparma laevis f. longispina]|uniref:G-patch domain-containing protein n=1 Tax=Triparma laevis f. longispina TaxID=1714387 RepID=A0A9W6Z469_9STRA|nr:hypothetical protein TrLO_g3981 [Triparma laevis f. longispina]